MNVGQYLKPKQVRLSPCLDRSENKNSASVVDFQLTNLCVRPIYNLGVLAIDKLRQYRVTVQRNETSMGEIYMEYKKERIPSPDCELNITKLSPR